MSRQSRRATEKAVLALGDAAYKRAMADKHEERGDMIGARFVRKEAEVLEKEASELSTLPPFPSIPKGAGSEVAPGHYPDAEDASLNLWFKDTLDHPNMVSVQASRKRMELALKVGDGSGGGSCLDMALDVAGTIKAKNSLEKMLAHQMAAAHDASMLLMAKGLEILGDGQSRMRPDLAIQEASRLIGVSLKAQTTFQSAFITLAKVRGGGRQEVRVIHQHVNVTDGGQAVVAGSLDPRGVRNGGMDGK